MEDRLSAATEAGFSGIGLYIGEYQRLKAAGLAHGWLDEQLARYGQCVAEIEVVRGWATDDQSDAAHEFELLAWEMADRFQSRYLQAIGPYDGSAEDAGRRFGSLCDRASDHGLVVGLEFLPFTNIIDARDALNVVEIAGRDNGGVCVDIWHHVRGANDQALIDAIPTEKIMGIQMSDGPLAQEMESYYDDCLRRRRAPREGDMPTTQFVRGLIDKGVSVPWSLEVCNDEVWGQLAFPHVMRCATGMNATLREARSFPKT